MHALRPRRLESPESASKTALPAANDAWETLCFEFNRIATDATIRQEGGAWLTL